MQQMEHDLIVIGGGVLGTFHAYFGLLAGKTVLQLEKDNYPVSSTVRNFGQVVPSGMSGEWFEYGKRSTEVYKQIQKEFDISVRQNGSVYIASDENEIKLIRELQEHFQKTSYDSSILQHDDLTKKYPALNADYAQEGLFIPGEVSVEPEKMIHSLHQYMQMKFSSYRLRYNATAIFCEQRGGEATVRLSSGELITGEKVIICNGYEFKLLFPGYFFSSGTVVSKLQMMRTIALPGVELEGNILTGLTIRRYESFAEYCPSYKTTTTPEHYQELKKWGIHILFKKAIDGSIIIGDSHEYAAVDKFDDLGFSISGYINDLMLTEASRIVNFDVRQIQNTWAGFYAQHPEKNIVTLDVDDCIHVRTAIGGKGMTASAGYAEKSIYELYHGTKAAAAGGPENRTMDHDQQATIR